MGYSTTIYGIQTGRQNCAEECGWDNRKVTGLSVRWSNRKKEDQEGDCDGYSPSDPNRQPADNSVSILMDLHINTSLFVITHVHRSYNQADKAGKADPASALALDMFGYSRFQQIKKGQKPQTHYSQSTTVLQRIPHIIPKHLRHVVAILTPERGRIQMQQ